MNRVQYIPRFVLTHVQFYFCMEYVSLATLFTTSMTAPRYRTTYGMGLTCADIYRVNDALIQYDTQGTPIVINNQNNDIRVPYFKCPNLTNPTAGMATSTNNTNITKKMLYAQNIRVATETKNVKKVYAVNNINRFGRWSGAPGGFGAPVTNSF